MQPYQSTLISRVDTQIMESNSPILDRGDFMRMVIKHLKTKLENTWRVRFNANGTIRLTSFALPQKNLAAAECLNRESLPQWIKERLVVLQICEQGTILEGIGQKVSDNVYYVIE